ncbi:Cell division protein FtsH [hydrothermal vent metagenome]|uniref:Cell division protein FtsH n=1 Tax=hydrothermal vent metagenome TaxID=652676 RepID=A0A3B0Y608_9ZZZZ
MIAEKSLALEISEFDSVDAAYPAELGRCREALLSGLPVLIECDKELTPYFYKSIRDRLRDTGRTCLYLDGRASAAQAGAMASSIVNSMITELRDAVRGSVEQSLIVLPHIDLLTTSSGGLTTEAKEVIALMYENPTILWLAFKDHSFTVPTVIENLFPHRETIIGIPRDRLQYLVTQRECRKFGRDLDLFALYKYVSGVNSVRLRRLLSALKGGDYPENPALAYQQLRTATLSGQLSIPEIDLNTGIGGYRKVKQRLNKEILALLKAKDQTNQSESVDMIESLIPKGMIFWGPPGTGKTLFAKAMASFIGAAVIVVSGPELKSRWVGESEEQIRQLFVQARTCAPCIIIFDELDSFATARGTYSGSGVEHSMVNQLLTELDGFRDNEMVFVVGTTNFAESLDPALLRPGRFEFQLHIPFPNAEDRHEIFAIYNKKFSLNMSERALDFAVKRTADKVEGAESLYTGDHIQALCRSLARQRLRENITATTEITDVERAMTEYLDRPELTSQEELVVATHECGHAICALHCDHVPPIDRISILGDLAGALGFVRYSDPAQKYVITQASLLDSICVLFGGREAELLLLDDVSVGAAQDIESATNIARSLVEEYGLGPNSITVRSYIDYKTRGENHPPLSEQSRIQLDEAISVIMDEQRQRAKQIIQAEQKELLVLREMLLDKKVIDRQMLQSTLSTGSDEMAD